MQHNDTVTQLDFSDNAIGGGYEKTQRVPGGPTTGGASIALALGVNTTLRRIDLQWNLLGSKVRAQPNTVVATMFAVRRRAACVHVHLHRRSFTDTSRKNEKKSVYSCCQDTQHSCRWGLTQQDVCSCR